MDEKANDEAYKALIKRTPDANKKVAAIDQLFKRMRSSSSALTQTNDQYSQGPGTQRKTSPATATWQTDGNDR